MDEGDSEIVYVERIEDKKELEAYLGMEEKIARERYQEVLENYPVFLDDHKYTDEENVGRLEKAINGRFKRIKKSADKLVYVALLGIAGFVGLFNYKESENPHYNNQAITEHRELGEEINLLEKVTLENSPKIEVLKKSGDERTKKLMKKHFGDETYDNMVFDYNKDKVELRQTMNLEKTKIKFENPEIFSSYENAESRRTIFGGIGGGILCILGVGSLMLRRIKSERAESKRDEDLKNIENHKHFINLNMKIKVQGESEEDKE